jgi:translation elongation factor EF-Tu-like GTPase
MERPPYRRPRGPADLEARITFRGTDSGGRRGPVTSGYRPNHDFGLPGELNDAQHEYPDAESVHPGESARALLWLLAPERQTRRLHTGFRFTVQEGRKVVGHGEVVRVLNASLERAP